MLGGLLAGLLLAAWLIDPLFVTPRTQMRLSFRMWELAILALPMTFIIITGGIDLSVGAAMALSSVVLGLVYQATGSAWLGAVVALGTGALLGACNGFFVARLRVHPLIVTLATLAAFRGVAVGISKGAPVSGFPERFTWIGRETLAGMPVAGICFLALALLAGLVLMRTPLGRQVYTIGHNETAGRFSGLPVARVKFQVYLLSGLAAALAAVIYVARSNTAKADIGTNMELEVITAVVLGGTSIYGGRGRIPGVVLGVLLMHELREFIAWQWARAELVSIVTGVLLIGSVLLHRLIERGKGGRDAAQ